ncbi:MAG: hypothetical protein ACP5OE_09895 [Thermodesulfobium sp.]
MEKTGFFEFDSEADSELEKPFSCVISDFASLKQYGVKTSFVLKLSNKEAKKLAEMEGTDLFLIDLENKYVVKFSRDGKEEYKISDRSPYEISLVYLLEKQKRDKAYLRDLSSLYG